MHKPRGRPRNRPGHDHDPDGGTGRYLLIAAIIVAVIVAVGLHLTGVIGARSH